MNTLYKHNIMSICHFLQISPTLKSQSGDSTRQYLRFLLSVIGGFPLWAPYIKLEQHICIDVYYVLPVLRVCTMVLYRQSSFQSELSSLPIRMHCFPSTRGKILNS